MRDDMFKVIVERPRWGASHAASPKLKRIPQTDARHIGLKRHAGIGAPYTKSLNENLAPLIRYLRRQRGRRLQRDLRQARHGQHGQDARAPTYR